MMGHRINEIENREYIEEVCKARGVVVCVCVCGGVVVG